MSPNNLSSENIPSSINYYIRKMIIDYVINLDEVISSNPSLEFFLWYKEFTNNDKICDDNIHKLFNTSCILNNLKLAKWCDENYTMSERIVGVTLIDCFMEKTNLSYNYDIISWIYLKCKDHMTTYHLQRIIIITMNAEYNEKRIATLEQIIDDFKKSKNNIDIDKLFVYTQTKNTNAIKLMERYFPIMNCELCEIFSFAIILSDLETLIYLRHKYKVGLDNIDRYITSARCDKKTMNWLMKEFKVTEVELNNIYHIYEL